MTTLAITADLLHALVAGSRTDGVTTLAVRAVIGHDEVVLLVADPGGAVSDGTWVLPGGAVLPAPGLTDALDPVAAALEMSITEVTGRPGHHEQHTGQHLFRTFRFAVTATDPDATCGCADTGHRAARPGDLPAQPRRPNHRGWCPAEPPAPTPEATEPHLSVPLRAWASGSHPDEAAVELLIAHAAFLHRGDFTDRFVDTGARHDTNPTTASIDWPAAITALEAGDLPCSRSEERILRLAGSLGAGLPVDLRDATTGLDISNTALLSQSVRHAAGHQPSPQNH